MKKLLTMLGSLVFAASPLLATTSCSIINEDKKHDLSNYIYDNEDKIINLAQFSTVQDLEKMLISSYAAMISKKLNQTITNHDLALYSLHNGVTNLIGKETESIDIIDVSQSLTFNFKADDSSKYLTGQSRVAVIDSKHLIKNKVDINQWDLFDQYLDNSTVTTGKELFKVVIDYLNSHFRKGLIQITQDDLTITIKHGNQYISDDSKGINYLVGNLNIQLEAKSTSSILTGSTVWVAHLEVYDLSIWSPHQLAYDNNSQSSNADFLNNYLMGVVEHIGKGIVSSDFQITVNTHNDNSGHDISTIPSSTNIRDVAGKVYVTITANGASGSHYSHLLKGKKTVEVELTAMSTVDMTKWDLPTNQWVDNDIIHDLSNKELVEQFVNKQYYHLVENNFITDPKIKALVHDTDFNITCNSIEGVGTKKVDVSFTVGLNTNGDAYKNNLLSAAHEMSYSVIITDKAIDISTGQLPTNYWAQVWNFEFDNLEKNLIKTFIDNLAPGLPEDAAQEISAKIFTNGSDTTDITTIRQAVMNSQPVQIQFSVNSGAKYFVVGKTTQLLSLNCQQTIANLQQDVFKNLQLNVAEIGFDTAQDQWTTDLKQLITRDIISNVKYQTLKATDLSIDLGALKQTDLCPGSGAFNNIHISVVNSGVGSPWTGQTTVDLAAQQVVADYKHDGDLSNYTIQNDNLSIKLSAFAHTTEQTAVGAAAMFTQLAHYMLDRNAVFRGLYLTADQQHTMTLAASIQQDVKYYNGAGSTTRPVSGSLLVYATPKDNQLNYVMDSGKVVIPWVLHLATINYVHDGDVQIQDLHQTITNVLKNNARYLTEIFN